VLVWLSVWSEVQFVCIWSSWCHCHPKAPSSLASLMSRLVLPFWYWLTQVVLEKRPLNSCSSSTDLTPFAVFILRVPYKIERTNLLVRELVDWKGTRAAFSSFPTTIAAFLTEWLIASIIVLWIIAAILLLFRIRWKKFRSRKRRCERHQWRQHSASIAQNWYEYARLPYVILHAPVSDVFLQIQCVRVTFLWLTVGLSSKLVFYYFLKRSVTIIIFPLNHCTWAVLHFNQYTFL